MIIKIFIRLLVSFSVELLQASILRKMQKNKE